MTPGTPERAYLDALHRLHHAIGREADAVQRGEPTGDLLAVALADASMTGRAYNASVRAAAGVAA